MKNVLTSLAKKVLMPLGLTAAASATDAGTQTKRWKISSKQLNTLKNLVYWRKALVKRKTIKNKGKQQKGGFQGMLAVIQEIIYLKEKMGHTEHILM